MKRFFEDLQWGPAFRRAAIFVALWLLTLYILNTAAPGFIDLGLDDPAGVTALALNAVLFFFLFTAVTAFTERSKRRRIARMRDAEEGKNPRTNARARGKTGAEPDDGDADSGVSGDGESDLRGRQNPNTSRKKSTRRRRR